LSELSATGSTKAGLRPVVFYSLMTGLCPLIPVPLVDDWVRDLLRRRLVADLVEKSGLELSSDDVRVLAVGHHPPTVEGCLRGCVAFTVLKPIAKISLKILRKFFRKILVFLMIKDSVDTFSQTFHEAYLVRHALALGALGGRPAPAIEVRRAVEAAVAEQDHRPVERVAKRTFRTSWRLIRQGAGQLTRLARSLRQDRSTEEDEQIVGELDLAEEDTVLGGVVDELTQELEGESGYLRHLESLLEKRLERVL
jgi:hypothetical protein